MCEAYATLTINGFSVLCTYAVAIYNCTYVITLYFRSPLSVK